MVGEWRIADIIQHLISQLNHRTSSLQAQQPDSEEEILELEAELKAVHLAHVRAVGFKTGSASSGLCPRCWIMDGDESPLRPIGGGKRGQDFFRCGNCDLKLIEDH
jgi:hypothetical protein